MSKLKPEDIKDLTSATEFSENELQVGLNYIVFLVHINIT